MLPVGTVPSGSVVLLTLQSTVMLLMTTKCCAQSLLSSRQKSNKQCTAVASTKADMVCIISAPGVAMSDPYTWYNSIYHDPEDSSGSDEASNDTDRTRIDELHEAEDTTSSLCQRHKTINNNMLPYGNTSPISLDMNIDNFSF